ncbi:MAG: chromosomal replication initiator protein DnaA [Chloroflexi bacterium]|nr:chromosomal replication initiator protein DnaA [Chloroflexota bacterium]
MSEEKATERTPKDIWQATLGQLQLMVTRPNYDTWLKDTVPLGYENNVFVVGAATTFATEYLEKRLKSLIKKSLTSVMGQPTEVRIILSSGDGRLREDKGKSPYPSPRLNPKYTFDAFIVGSCNRLVYAAAWAVTEKPGVNYNPLFIYGASGLGKTHILHAIGHRALAQGLRVIYVSSEQFTNEFIQAIREKKNEEFRGKYRSADFLLIDDIHFIAGKEQTQEEFFHTFNELHSAHHQIALTSDRTPKALPILEERLRSRFEWGLIADLQPPDWETRLAILHAKAEEQKMALPGEVMELIARRFQSNIRQLEGAINRVIAFARLTRTPLTLETASRALEDIGGPRSQRKVSSPAKIIDAVAEHFGLDPEDLKGKQRRQPLAHARHIAMYLLREEGQLSLSAIGDELGGRDHSTVLHGCDKISQELESNGVLRSALIVIREHLNAEGTHPR